MRGGATIWRFHVVEKDAAQGCRGHGRCTFHQADYATVTSVLVINSVFLSVASAVAARGVVFWRPFHILRKINFTICATVATVAWTAHSSLAKVQTAKHLRFGWVRCALLVAQWWLCVLSGDSVKARVHWPRQEYLTSSVSQSVPLSVGKKKRPKRNLEPGLDDRLSNPILCSSIPRPSLVFSRQSAPPAPSKTYFFLY